MIERGVSPLTLKALTAELAELSGGAALNGHQLRIMEVCGTHTMSVAKHGLKKLLPSNVELISGPGCPVCVTPAPLLAQALDLAHRPNVIITSFGDMLRVPIAGDSLLKAREQGCDVRLVISPLEALQIALQEPQKQVVFLAVGFETTAPLSAATVRLAAERGLDNFSLLCAHRLMPPALTSLLSGGPRINGLLLPGHVAAVTGARYFDFVPRQLQIPAVVAGFEPTEIMTAMVALACQAAAGECRLENAYQSAVRNEANPTAWAALTQVFAPAEALWHGLGAIADSGLMLRPAYAAYDTAARFELTEAAAADNSACRCGQVLSGWLTPRECPLFGSACTPESPQGACMVSSEGACAAEYRYN